MRAKSPTPPTPLPSTIGDNPLDALVPLDATQAAIRPRTADPGLITVQLGRDRLDRLRARAATAGCGVDRLIQEAIDLTLGRAGNAVVLQKTPARPAALPAKGKPRSSGSPRPTAGVKAPAKPKAAPGRRVATAAPKAARPARGRPSRG